MEAINYFLRKKSVAPENDVHLDVRYLEPKPSIRPMHPVRGIVSGVVRAAMISLYQGAIDPRFQLGIPGKLRYEYWVFDGKFDAEKLRQQVQANLRNLRAHIDQLAARQAEKLKKPITEETKGYKYQFALHVSWMSRANQHSYTVGIVRF